jgi:hypothetical protein
MTFNKEFLRKIQERLNCSDSYPMTKTSVDFLVKSKKHDVNDKRIIFDAIRNDIFRNGDPLLVKQFWNENINDSNLRIE